MYSLIRINILISIFTKIHSHISEFPSNTLGRNKGSQTDRKVILQYYRAVLFAKG